MIRKIFQFAFIAFILGSLLAITVQTIHRPTLVSTENRTLAKKPEWPGSINDLEGFVKNIDAWWSDSIHYRQDFIRIYNGTRARLGISPQRDVIVGKSGWLFYNAEHSIDDYRNSHPFTQQELEDWKNYLLFRHLDAERRGIVYLFFVAPNKENIYGDYLPDNITKISMVSRMDQLLNAMRDTPVRIVDLRPVLMAAKKNEQVYHKTGTHWNLVGASYAQEAIITNLKLKFPDLKLTSYNAGDFYGAGNADFVAAGIGNDGGLTYALGMVDYEGRINPPGMVDLYTNEMQPLFKKLPTDCVRPGSIPLHKEWAVMPENEQKQFFVVDNCASGKHRVVMFRDSFGDALRPYFSSTFNYIAYIWLGRSEMLSWSYFLDTAKPDIVLDETVERFLSIIPQRGVYYPADFDPVKKTWAPFVY